MRSAQASGKAGLERRMINIIIADDEPIFRTGAARVLASEDDLRIVAQPQSVVQVLNAVARLRADVLLISNNFLQPLLESQPQPRQPRLSIVVLAESQDAAATFVAKGAQGVVYRSIEGAILVQAVRRIAAGEIFIHAPNSTIKEVHDDMVGAYVMDRLSDFELRIIGAVMRSYRNREIAEQFNTSEQTVKNTMRSIFDKIGVSDRLELVLFVYHHRMLEHATQEIQITANGINRPSILAPATTSAPSDVIPWRTDRNLVVLR